ncbi:hypothetical protein NW755_009212 [Fusarium falciforme]|uniref:Uncharacterized protein n=1 Tax=Fusarium falciforme TaxID=195108 RepID=A0A9W8R3Y1_9HYPO|nr:hypothetical protein NW755_009212 [Fusarium falciforme]
MTDLQDSLGSSKVLEILYDPQVPWFKVIAYVEYQAEILRWMQSRLEQLLEEEAGAIDQDADQEDEFDIGGSKVQPDVEVLADKPHIVSWPVYSEGLEASVGKYDTFRFPQHIQELPHKTIWRGLECVEGATISDLTSKFDILWPTLDSKTSLRKLEEPGNLQVTYNCTETLAYIGTESDAQSLETAIRKLDTLLSFMDAPFTKESHLILAEAARPFRVSYQCLTHTGLSNLTYMDPTITFGADQERKLIEGAASLRVVTADARGRLSLDPTVYPLEHKLAKDPKLGFSPFAHYEYTNKRSNTSDSTEIRSIHQTRRQQQLLKKAAQPVKTPKETSRISKGLVNIENEGNEPKILSSATGKKKVQKETGLEGILFSELRGDSWQGSRSPLPTETSVANWINGIELNYAKGSLELIPGLSEGNEVQHGITPDMTASVMTLAGGALLDLGSDDLQAGLEQTPKNSETQHLELLNFEEMIPSRQPVGVRTPKLRPGDDSIPNLLDSESPVKEFHGMFAHVDPFTLAVETGLNQGGNTCEKQKTLPPGESLMDYLDCHVHTPALMDSMDRDKQKSQSGKENKSAAGHSSGVVFGKQGDATKEFFQTMRQKAASRPTWANIASKKKPTEGQNEEAPFGPNVRVSTVLAIPKPAGSEQKENRTRVNAMGSQTFLENEPPSQNDGPSRGKSLGLATVSRDTSLPASATRAVPGMDLVTPDFMEGIEVVAKAEGKLQELVRIIQVTPGLICLEAKFGRVCFKNQPPSLVNIGQGPAWSSESVLDRLNSNEHESQGTVGFYTILTTNGAEADLLSQLTASKTSWMLREKQVYYEIVCRSHDGVTSLVVKVDANTFEYECLPTTQELSHLYVHCARRAWDIKFAISRMDLEAVPEDFKLFARSLVDSMSISSKNTGQIEIEADQDVRFGWQIERINIRHLAKYRNGPKGRSCLAITMTRIVKKFPNASNKHKTKFRGQTVPTTPPGKGSPTQWFEAHISSTRAEKLFEENLGLVFGERTRWTVEKLMEDGILSALCEPALRMVTKMDHVGESNSTSQGFRTTGGQAYGTIDDTRDGKQEYQFW